jgi:hypothetical protein
MEREVDYCASSGFNISTVIAVFPDNITTLCTGESNRTCRYATAADLKAGVQLFFILLYFVLFLFFF